MDRTLRAVLDHVAIAVPDPDVAEKRWRDQLGGGLVAFGGNGVFSSRQLRFAGGGKLELLSPSPDSDGDGFVERFLSRFGTAIHHVTLKVPDLAEAIATVEAAGLDVVDVQDEHEHWREAFLGPSQVGGLIVQIAWASDSDEVWARRVGHMPEDPAPGAPTLHGPRLLHPDLVRAAELWRLLGATVDQSDDIHRCTWPDSPLDVLVETGPQAGPAELRMTGTGPLPPDADLGPAVLPRR
jgi:catechol 2,3-dioxygenase-like lactoylglutathione lyase family enzyme